MRNEGEHILDSLEETFRVGREANVPVVISHHKVAGKPNHGRSAETLPVIAKAMREQRVALDCYPYHVFDHPFGEPRGECDEGARHWSKPHPEAAGMDLEEIKNKLNLSVEDLCRRGASTSRWTRRMCSAFARAHDDRLRRPAARRGPHPRLWGTFPRVLGHYSRTVGLFP